MGIIKKIRDRLSFSCMRITEMVESKEENKLSFGHQIRYNMHLATCKACKSYEKQSDLIGKALSRLMPSPDEDPVPMEDTSKQKILDSIKKHKK